VIAPGRPALLRCPRSTMGSDWRSLSRSHSLRAGSSHRSGSAERPPRQRRWSWNRRPSHFRPSPDLQLAPAVSDPSFVRGRTGRLLRPGLATALIAEKGHHLDGPAPPAHPVVLVPPAPTHGRMPPTSVGPWVFLRYRRASRSTVGATASSVQYQPATRSSPTDWSTEFLSTYPSTPISSINASQAARTQRPKTVDISNRRVSTGPLACTITCSIRRCRCMRLGKPAVPQSTS